MRYLPGIIFLAVFCFQSSYAQDSKLEILFNKKHFNAGDTLSFDAFAEANGRKIMKGTLFLKVLDQNGRIKNFRWPIFDGVCNVDFILPDSIPSGPLRLLFAASNNFFALFGRVVSPKKIKSLQATLVTAGKDLLMEEIPVEGSGEFSYKNRLFENDATIFFKIPKTKNQEDLNVDIVSLLDSTFEPLATSQHMITIGEVDTLKKNILPDSAVNYASVDSFLRGNEKMLQEVVVTAKKLTREEQFSEKYSRGMFRQADERLINIMDNTSALGYFSILEFLQGRVAGLRIISSVTGGSSAVWRGEPVTFYVDEFRVDIETIQSIPVSNIAIVKAFPPPFYGNTFGEGGAVAIYTKRGDYYGNSNRKSFIIRGYTPQISVLNLRTAEK